MVHSSFYQIPEQQTVFLNTPVNNNNQAFQLNNNISNQQIPSITYGNSGEFQSEMFCSMEDFNCSQSHNFFSYFPFNQNTSEENYSGCIKSNISYSNDMPPFNKFNNLSPNYLHPLSDNCLNSSDNSNGSKFSSPFCNSDICDYTVYNYPKNERTFKRLSSSGRKESHNIIERKYRSQISECFKYLERATFTSPTNKEPNTYTKSMILRSATDKINTLESDKKQLVQENKRLKEQLKAYQNSPNITIHSDTQTSISNKSQEISSNSSHLILILFIMMDAFLTFESITNNNDITNNCQLNMYFITFLIITVVTYFLFGLYNITIFHSYFISFFNNNQIKNVKDIHSLPLIQIFDNDKYCVKCFLFMLNTIFIIGLIKSSTLLDHNLFFI